MKHRLPLHLRAAAAAATQKDFLSALRVCAEVISAVWQEDTTFPTFGLLQEAFILTPGTGAETQS